MSFATCLFVVIGGAVGTLARYLISVAALPISQTLPWGTIAINILGSFVIGLFGTLNPVTRSLSRLREHAIVHHGGGVWASPPSRRSACRPSISSAAARVGERSSTSLPQLFSVSALWL